MQAVILLAGYGSRLGRDDLPHKSLLPFNGETLLSRHLISLETLEIERAYLVVGHNKDKIKKYVRGLNLKLGVDFIDNDIYQTTGNTLSLVMGLRCCQGDVIILDGDVLYPKPEFFNYVKNSKPNSMILFDYTGGPRIVRIQTVWFHYSAINFLVPEGLDFLV